MLGAFDIKYMPCTAIKGQILVNLVAKFTKDAMGDEKLRPSVLAVSASSPTAWEVYSDGAANQKGSGVGIVLVSLEKIVVEKSLRLGFSTTNNETEYEALLAGMAMVGRLGDKVVEVYSNSRLVVGQANGEFEAKDQRM